MKGEEREGEKMDRSVDRGGWIGEGRSRERTGEERGS